MNQINEDTSQTTHSEPEQWHERGELVELLGYSLFVIDESPDQNAIDSVYENKFQKNIIQYENVINDYNQMVFDSMQIKNNQQNEKQVQEK